MKKLTAGIFSVLIGLCSMPDADAAVASKQYVDAETVNVTYGDSKAFFPDADLQGFQKYVQSYLIPVAETINQRPFRRSDEVDTKRAGVLSYTAEMPRILRIPDFYRGHEIFGNMLSPG